MAFWKKSNYKYSKLFFQYGLGVSVDKCLRMYWMFSILPDCTSQSSKQYERFCLPRCLFLSPILLWHLSVEQMSVLSVEHLRSVAPFYSLPYQSAILPSQPPPRWMWHCVCACHKRRAADRKGVPRTVTMAQVRTSFCSEWKHPECLMDKDQSQAENVCHTACESIWLPSAPLLPSHVEQRTQTGAEGAVCNCVPEGFGSNIQTCVCVLSSCTSFTALSFSSLRKYCVVVAGWTLLRSSPYFVAVLGDGPVIKINLVKMIWEKKPLLYLVNAVSVCLSLLQEPAGVGFIFQS